MLILSRKLNESIVIDGRIIVKILRIERETVKLGIQAPQELQVHRQEVYDMIQRNKSSGHPPGDKGSPPSAGPGGSGSGPAPGNPGGNKPDQPK
jgi:carbon storage regulator